jgi:TRAP transporter TAXI family solute receptor
MKRTMLLLVTLILAAAAVYAGGGSEKAKQETLFMNIGTGGTAGTYYPMGGAIAEIINANVPGVNSTAVSTGASVANINKLGEGEFQMIFVQNDVTYYAYNGTEMFQERSYPTLRGIATLYSETIHIVTVEGAGIRSFADLRGKRIAVGAAGSGTEVNARQILEVLGLTYNDIRPQYLSFAEAANGLRDGTVDAAVVTAGVPTAAIRDVAAQRNVVIVPVPDDLADPLIARYPFYTKFTIPAGTYPGQNSPVQTIAVKAMLVVDASLDEQIAYNITKAIFENVNRIALAHAQGRAISVETADEGMPVPLHPGAERYFNER